MVYQAPGLQLHVYIESIITKLIITNIARGLSYVRQECRQVIAYPDIKPHKILLDDSFNTKIY
jgi:serine/threonine protein kinase